MPAKATIYDPAAWTNFFSAEVGASAALAGLLFVAVSINLTKIISFKHLTSRVAKGLVTLVGVLFASSLCLVPGQSATVLGGELIVLGSIAWLIITGLQRSASHENPHISRGHKLGQVALAQGSAIPTAVCGLSLLCSQGGGLYWLVAAVVTSMTAAITDAWVLLIEIQR